MTTSARTTGAAVVVVLGAVLTGCTSPAAPAASSSTEGSEVPEWPRVEGRVVSQSRSANDLVVRIAVRDPEAAYAQARERLVDGGYQLTKDREGRGGGDGQACTPALCVNFSANDDPTSGPGLTYETFHSSGVAPLD